LRDPREDPIPPILEDLTSVRLSSEITSLLQEIWATKQRINKQLLVKRAYRWMVEEQGQQQGKEQGHGEDITTRAARVPRAMRKRALNGAQGRGPTGKKRCI
jgi:hypothetical protein